MANAWARLCERDSMGTARGYGMSEREMFEYVCEFAGITIERGLELNQRRKQWPDAVPDWAREKEKPDAAPEIVAPAPDEIPWQTKVELARERNAAEKRRDSNLRANADAKRRLRENFSKVG